MHSVYKRVCLSYGTYICNLFFVIIVLTFSHEKLKKYFNWNIVDLQYHTHIYIYIYIYILFHILFHYGLSQDIEYIFMCSTLRSCCLSILYIINSLHLLIPNSQSIPLPPTSPLANTSLSMKNFKYAFYTMIHINTWVFRVLYLHLELEGT